MLTVDVRRSSSTALPVRIRIDTGPCLLWGGKTGDVISVMVSETPRQGGVYGLHSCN
jgi:acetamidase/formamidase